MRLPDPINDVGAPGFASAELTSVQPIMQDEMPNTTVLSVSSGEQYWALALQYSDLLPQEYGVLNAAIDRTIANKENLEIWLPQYEDFTFKLSDNTVKSSNNYSATFLATGMRSVPKPGYMLQFQNHKKVYRISKFTQSGANVTIEFYPDLRKPVPAGTAVKFTNILFNMQFADRSNPISGGVLNSDGYFGEGINLNLREAI